MPTENVTDDLKPTTQTSYFRLAILSVIVGPFLVILLLWLSNKVLPPELAKSFNEPLLTVWKAVASMSFLATLIGGLMRTQGKIKSQHSNAMVKAGRVPFKEIGGS